VVLAVIVSYLLFLFLKIETLIFYDDKRHINGFTVAVVCDVGSNVVGAELVLAIVVVNVAGAPVLRTALMEL
jgi:hypothetical protein